MVSMCMGEQGIISRVLGVRGGQRFHFSRRQAQGRETAPGQVTAQELRNVYRIDQVDAATRVYAVVGDPIAHSLSPAIMKRSLPPGERQRGLSGPACEDAKRLADLRARDSYSRNQRNHALQGSDPAASG